jgi:site-specific recombinase XerD
MSRHQLAIVGNADVAPLRVPFSEMLADHCAVLQGYLDTHVERNHSEGTLERERILLAGWFEDFIVADQHHPDGERQLLLWEAMTPGSGRQRIQAFSKGLVESGLKPRTVAGHVGSLRRLFDYVVKWPYIPGDPMQRIDSKYGRIEQPVLEYDYPVHAIEPEEEDFALTGEHLRALYDFIRLVYIPQIQKKLPASRTYAMVVVAAESGLRADEISHLDVTGAHKDLFYEYGRIQTRHGKGTKGSGKRIRKTIFTPFAQDTMRVYVEKIRPGFPNANSNVALFLSESGTRLTYKAMWQNLRNIEQAARKAGLDLPPRFGWHSLRRSFATEFAEKHPKKLWLLMEMLGHISPSTLHHYIKHTKSYYDDQMNEIIDEFNLT